MTWTAALLRAVTDPEALMADAGSGDALRPLLTSLCATYLLERRPLQERGPGAAAGGAAAGGRQRVRDPVAHFHFGNGALLQALHWRCAPPRSLPASLNRARSGTRKQQGAAEL